MIFSEKLDFLMSMTKTTNSALALYLSLDASHVSRLRRGERKLSKSGNYLEMMAAYFSRHCQEGYQRKALSEVINLPEDAFDNSLRVAQSLILWLKKEEMWTPETMVSPTKKSAGAKCPPAEKESLTLYYGTEGKRRAALAFLTKVLESKEPRTLLLFSDEDTEWMTGDPAFMMKWASLMVQAVSAGNRIRIIHTLNRNLDEMMTALNQWMPLYMTGSIEPYYYPKKRDGVLKRTLFVAPGLVAVSSTSTVHSGEENVIIFAEDGKVVQSFRQEFMNYFSQCRQLMKIYTRDEQKEHLRMLSEFEQSRADTVLRTESLSLLTMPDTVLASVAARINEENQELLLENMRNRQRLFMNHLKENRFTEVIRLEKPETVREGRARISISCLFQMEDLYYTEEEYAQHLENMIFLLESNDNYHVYIEESPRGEGVALYAKEDLGAVIFKVTAPAITFSINESNMTAALWDYLKNKTGENRQNRNQVLERLKTFSVQKGDEYEQV